MKTAPPIMESGTVGERNVFVISPCCRNIHR
uniref:Uncharacterized protein n=1 Tax=Rhizophora mucronata TaxID=61149 RepID=A0A2P2QK61_RHIMU